MPAVLSSFTSTVAAFLPPAMVRRKRAGRKAGAGSGQGPPPRPAASCCDFYSVVTNNEYVANGFGSACACWRPCCASSWRGAAASLPISQPEYRRLRRAIVLSTVASVWLRSRPGAVPLGSPRAATGRQRHRSSRVGGRDVSGLQLGAAHAGQGAPPPLPPPVAAAARSGLQFTASS